MALQSMPMLRVLLCLLCLPLLSAPAAAEQCRVCHGASDALPSTEHAACSACHGGDPAAAEAAAAHSGLRAAPGELGDAAASCGGCHAAQVASVSQGRMHTGAGMVGTTRALLDGDPAAGAAAPARLDALGDSVADSLLRRLCASCHLGQPRSGENPVTARGGGCLACHLQPDTGGRHPRVGLPVRDSACFGCHSRSGRIALNYAGLAEVDPPTTALGWQGLARLPDGRLVERHAADIHHRAGMGCTDCHTGPGLMGALGVIDIACEDCHANQRPRLTPASWPPGLHGRLRHLPFEAGDDQPFLQTAHGTPLWHIQLGGGQVLLHPKGGGAPRPVPQLDADHVPEAAAHQDLACDACHATWAPQCHGCHVSYDAAGRQWDHLARAVRPGAWQERRWGIRNNLPPLGRAADGRVRPVVPGMIASIEHPDWAAPRFLRRFAVLSPHTTGKARACNACHGQPRAWGLGEGRVLSDPSGLRFEPAVPALQDGLPADAWSDLDGTASTRLPGDPRPWERAQLERLLQPVDPP
jgi:hypothetical protein